MTIMYEFSSEENDIGPNFSVFGRKIMKVSMFERVKLSRGSWRLKN